MCALLERHVASGRDYHQTFLPPVDHATPSTSPHPITPSLSVAQEELHGRRNHPEPAAGTTLRGVEKLTVTTHGSPVSLWPGIPSPALLLVRYSAWRSQTIHFFF